MSDNESLSEDSSHTTIEDLPVPVIIENLKLAAQDAIETEDYLSYSTLLDIYMGEPSKYSDDEKEAILQELLDVLTQNPKLTYEIGWDLPALLILYLELDYLFGAPLRSAPCFYKIVKIFEVLANHGNPKELFLKCCELLSSIKVDDITRFDEPLILERYFDLKLYCIFELIDNNLKRIQTLYPSRFLSMCVSAFINCLYINFNNFSPHHMDFIFKRVYSFTRNYNAPPVPKDYQLSKEELKKITDDENYLQRKLLTGLLTNSVFIVGKNYCPNHATLYFKDLSNKEVEHNDDIFVFDRLYELCLSYDIDLDKIFKNTIISTHEIFHKFDFGKEHEELVGDMFEALVVDYQKNFFKAIVNRDMKELHESELGCLVYHSHSIFSNNAVSNHDFPVSMTFHDALVLTLRLVVPQMVNPVFTNKSVQDLCVFWSWYAIEKLKADKKKLHLEISSIHKVLLESYCQVLLFICASNPSVEAKDFRFCALTLLTKVLILSPEQTSYGFIKDSLFHCPMSNVRAALIGILKELLTKDKVKDELAESLDKLSLDSKPALPSRNVEKSTKYVTLTKERFDDIISITDTTIEDTFNEIDDQDSETETEDNAKCYKLNHQFLSTLAVELNLLVVLKKFDTYTENKDKVDDVVKRMKAILKSLKVQYKESPSDLNVFDMLSLTLERIED